MPLLTLYGLGVTLGAGIYVLVGATAGQAGVHAPVAFLCAAVVVGVTAFSYAELAGRFPVSAGEAAYVEAGFGLKPLALAVGGLVALSGIVSSAAVAIGAGAYLSNLIGLPQPVLIAGTVVLMALIAVWGITESVTIAAVVTLIEVAGLVMVIGWGFLGPSEPMVSYAAIVPPLKAEVWTGIGAATLLAFFAFIGFEDMANVAEEVKEPARTYPRAVVLVLLVTTLLYTLTTLAVVRTVPLGQLAGSSAPLSLVFESAPRAIQDFFVGVAVIATLNGILIQIIMASRVTYGLASRGHLPSVLARVNARTRTPILATSVIAVIVLILSLTVSIEFLAERTSQVVLLTFVLVNLALVRIKRGEADLSDAAFKVPTSVPIMGAALSALVFLLAML